MKEITNVLTQIILLIVFICLAINGTWTELLLCFVALELTDITYYLEKSHARS